LKLDAGNLKLEIQTRNLRKVDIMNNKNLSIVDDEPHVINSFKTARPKGTKR